MHRVCGLLVERLGIKAGQPIDLYPKSTITPKYLTSQVFFVHKASTVFKQFSLSYSHKIVQFNPSYFSRFYPFSTTPINTIKLIKE